MLLDVLSGFLVLYLWYTILNDSYLLRSGLTIFVKALLLFV